MLQYLIGSRVTAEHFRRWICISILAFLTGLSGFAYFSSIYALVFFTAVFTVGEIIIQPLEFLYIARIAPPRMIGADYTSQNLAYLGSASTPVICGFVLASFDSMYFLLYLLVLLSVGGGMLYLEAGKIIQPPSHDL